MIIKNNFLKNANFQIFPLINDAQVSIILVVITKDLLNRKIKNEKGIKNDTIMIGYQKIITQPICKILAYILIVYRMFLLFQSPHDLRNNVQSMRNS